MCFRLADDGGWIGAAIKGSRIMRVRVCLDHDGLVRVVVDMGKTVPADRVEDYRIFQMVQNSVFATLGYERAEAGKPVVFSFRIAPARDVDLAKLVGNAIAASVQQVRALERIDRGEDASEVCFSIKKEYLRRRISRVVNGIVAQLDE